ncbi:RWD domain-containing protein 3-like isoform X2 [Acanthaster planci]|uniref:RWD domain-containing protein 3 n=1 Tax=Acanthaster planci TaxID=133434 RepID=A0A8B7XHF2_ACAPL|nr:RWD domain-containing protein 3-like isoform X2 [Acanthaster planci]
MDALKFMFYHKRKRQELPFQQYGAIKSFGLDSVNSMADDEVKALQGIFCGDGEFELLLNSDGEQSFSICVTCQPSETTTVDQTSDTLKISLQCFLPSGYPHEPPSISLACGRVTKQSANQLQDELREYSKSLLGQPMIMELVYWLQKNGTRLTAALVKNRDTSNRKDDSTPYVTILHIDYMRSRVRYIKTLVSWAAELSLVGRLLFLHHLILVLLIGTEDCVKDFLMRLRTQKVDIDSSGRSCKERMLTVLMQGLHPRPSDSRLIDFQVRECSATEELEDVFLAAGLTDGLKSAVLPKFPHLQRSSCKNSSKR